MDHQRLLGHTLGNYRIERRIGGGSMGEVFEATHVHLGRRAAVKVLRREMSQSEEAVSRFFTEARAAAHIRHWGLVEVYDVGLDESGSAYLVMEHLDGVTIADKVDHGGAMSLSQSLCVARQLAVAMASAHAAGVVHRDLKPENIVLVPDSDPPSGLRVKVCDFGIAKLASGSLLAGAPQMTRVGQIMGTPAFMAPEQCHGASEVDERADIYSLGCILYFMLTGRPPFVSDGIGATIAAQIYEQAPTPASLVPSLPAAVDALVMNLLEKSPGARPQTMDQVAKLLKNVSREPTGVVVERTRPTTITMASGAITPRPPGRRGLSAAWLVPAAAALAFVAWRGPDLLGDAGDGEALAAPPPALRMPAAEAPSLEQSTVQPPAAALAQVEPRKVTVRVTSRPEGAVVVHVKSGEHLGVTPFAIERIAEEGTLALKLSKKGYRSEPIELPADRDAQAQVVLEKRQQRGRPAAGPAGRRGR